MEETFREQRNETGRERGMGALLRMWWATIKDIFAIPLDPGTADGSGFRARFRIEGVL